MALAINRPAEGPRTLPVRWTVVALAAAVFAYIDGFWVAALQGAIGAIERLEMPFNRWLRDSSLMLPLFALAVVLAVVAARRLVGGRRSTVIKIAALALMLTLLGSAVTIGEAAVSSALDYRHQITHNTDGHGDPAVIEQTSGPTFALYCSLRGSDTGNIKMQYEYANLQTHLRALSIFSPLILATNLALAAMLLASLRGLRAAP